jgi:ribosome-associated toxin RatA of RatAB toxin-antitoxin module
MLRRLILLFISVCLWLPALETQAEQLRTEKTENSEACHEVVIAGVEQTVTRRNTLRRVAYINNLYTSVSAPFNELVASWSSLHKHHHVYLVNRRLLI